MDVVWSVSDTHKSISGYSMPQMPCLLVDNLKDSYAGCYDDRFSLCLRRKRAG